MHPQNLDLVLLPVSYSTQVGGFVSVSAHGTGAKLPPLDMAVVSMKVVTPGLGTLTLSKNHHPDLFELAKVRRCIYFLHMFNFVR